MSLSTPDLSAPMAFWAFNSLLRSRTLARACLSVSINCRNSFICLCCPAEILTSLSFVAFSNCLSFFSAFVIPLVFASKIISANNFATSSAITLPSCLISLTRGLILPYQNRDELPTLLECSTLPIHLASYQPYGQPTLSHQGNLYLITRKNSLPMFISSRDAMNRPN